MAPIVLLWISSSERGNWAAAASRKTCSREGTSGLGVAVTFAQLVSITGRPTGDVSAAEETKTDCRPEEESRDS